MKRTALITGGSRGIGAACVHTFAAAGYNVIFCYEKADASAAEVCSREKALGFDVISVRADITNQTDINRLISLCEYHFGGLDILVNNAGICDTQAFTFTTLSERQRLIDVDLTAAINVTHSALRLLMQSMSGRIINVSSVWGVYGGSGEVVYSAAKAGLIGFTKALARELGGEGITVNCVAPGYIDTEMNSDYTEDDIKDVISRTPLCRIGTPSDVACAVLFLASTEASFITAQILGVDGGFM